ncbi:LysR family transcriptional regulator [Psychromarinibacter sp. C21-152]|uniref:LysR family transcriptional regulator n=1 Tax=Psychromarinibacter sediminicola TaxID=3033385 RepID=A0AAE3NUW9_9RHOB|nr:LysR family transcriptional regulator [Psychromarinibacter sediminicola]MDF0601067.1 LysR family transcriptional regulator [Psychromarinibacter sediminicola]
MFGDLPPLSQLRAFAALADTGSMSGAGAQLNVSHAAVSQQVRALEDRLGLKLVTREGRSVVLTPEGQRLGATLCDSFGAMAREIEVLTGADADRPLQVTCTPSFADRWLMPRLAGFSEAHPDIHLMLNPTAQLADPAPGGIDLAIRFGAGKWPGLEAELLLETRFAIVAARDLLGDRTITEPGELLDFPWLQEVGTNEAKEWLAENGVTEARVRRMTDLPGNLLQDAVRRGQGVGATARAFIEPEIARGEMVVLFEDERRGEGYWLVTRPGPQRPSLKAFCRWLRRQVKRDGAA